MPTPTLPIGTLTTANTFRQWLTTTNSIVDLVNSNTMLIAGYTVNGAFTLSKDSVTSLTVANSLTVNSSATYLKDNPVTIDSNVTISTSATSVSIRSNTFSIFSPNGTFINASAVTLNASALTTTSNVSITNASSFLTVSASTLVSGPVTLSNTVVLSGNTVYAKVVQISSDGVANAASSSGLENNYSPLGLDTATVLQIQPLSSVLVLTGLAAPATLTSNTGAKVLYLYNTSGTYKITLKSANNNSDVINQFKIAGDVDFDIPPGVSIPMLYTSVLKKWVPLNQMTAAFLQLQVSGDTTITGKLNVTDITTLNANLTANTSTNTLYVDVVNNRVGIGRIPNAGLHVATATIFDANVTFSAPMTIAAGMLYGNSSVNTTINSTAIVVSNSTTNTAVTSVLISTANTSGRANLEPGKLTIGTSVVNTSAMSTGNFTVTGSANINFDGTSSITITTGSPVKRDLYGVAPTGSIVMFAGSTVPTGWLLCNGQSISTSTYATLYGVIGTTYGGSGGSFSVPNLQQRFPLGASGVLGTTGGASSHSHSITTDTVAGHTHSVSGSTDTQGSHAHGFSYSTSFTTSSAGGHSHSFTTDAAGAHSHSFDLQQHTHGVGSITVNCSTSDSNTYTPSSDTGSYVATSSHGHTITLGGTTDGIDSNHSTTTGGVDGHTHTGSTDSVGGHTHTGTVSGSGSTDTQGSHSHSVTGTAATAGSHSHSGSSDSQSNLPPYLTLNFIIKT